MHTSKLGKRDIGEIMKRFHNKRAVVIGGTSGIGYHCAKKITEEGAKVVLVARGEENLKRVSKELEGTVGYIVADIAKRLDCQTIVSESIRLLGNIDIVIHCAAQHVRGPVLSCSVDDLCEMVRSNLEAPIYLSRSFLPSLITTKGVLILVSSLAGCIPLPNAATYSATKFGLRAFSIALSQEVKEYNVGVTVVSPGPVATRFILDDLDAVSDMTLSQPMLSPEYVARRILGAIISRPIEIQVPRKSGYLTTLGYIFPFLRRWLQPSLKRKGVRQRKRLQK